MPTVIPAASSQFGVSGSDSFQSKSITTKMDKKEAFDKSGENIALAFYGKMAEHSVELLGTDANTYVMGATATAPSGFAAVVGGTVWVVDELTINQVNDDFTKSSIKVSEYFIED